jgi:hypothetical protein
MLARTVKADQTTYTGDYQRKYVQKCIGRNLSTAVTTGRRYVGTGNSIYGSDYDETGQTNRYVRPRNFQVELMKLPPEYASSVRPNLEPRCGITDYQHYFGRPGEHALVKRSLAVKPRTLSKTTRANVVGTTRATHHPPKYDGFIPSEWDGNRGKFPHEDRNQQDITWQYHSMKTGYSGYVPSTESLTQSRGVMNRTRTTYRDMCDEIGFRLPGD